MSRGKCLEVALTVTLKLMSICRKSIPNVFTGGDIIIKKYADLFLCQSIKDVSQPECFPLARNVLNLENKSCDSVFEDYHDLTEFFSCTISNNQAELLNREFFVRRTHFSNRTVDIDPKPNSCGSINRRTEKPIWIHSDNTFRFNFLTENTPAPLVEKTPLSDREEPTRSQLSFTGQGSTFAFNFQIPPVAPEERMETTNTTDTAPDSQQSIQKEKSSTSQEVNAPLEPLKEKKKKNKSGKKKSLDCTEQQQNPEPGGIPGIDDAELSAEEQLNRQLDWCIEQLEFGMRSQKGTQKQKEDASRALKTLRSSKAPLVKKRQVMRAMTGDYRKKIEEEKGKQYKLIQSEVASAQVKVVTESSKKCLFHRRGGVKTQTSDTEKNSLKPEAQDTDSTPAFVFTPSEEKFYFNFH
ncbi:UPF0488 protein C8orf33 homolog [Antennarius striatus]|uniref:UPF0488 protein C8orf33 homolog n=1 Tax=Antennarius striatus TaxID=241820 RepID=UPI0035AE2A45